MSTQHVHEAFDVLTEKMRELEESVALIRQADEIADKKKAEREARKVYNLARTASNNLRKEVNKIEDATQKSVYARKQQESEDRLKSYDREMRNQLRPSKKRVDNEENAMAAIIGKGEEGGLDNATKTLQAANRAQDDNLRILQGIEREVSVVEATGEEIANKLAQDTEKIREIDKELNSLQANIDRAKGEVMWFARRMATDKCFLCLMVLVVVGILLLVFWKMYSSRKSGKGGTPAPETRAPPGGPDVPVPDLTAPPQTTSAVTGTAAARTSPATTVGAPATTVAVPATPAEVLAAVLAFVQAM